VSFRSLGLAGMAQVEIWNPTELTIVTSEVPEPTAWPKMGSVWVGAFHRQRIGAKSHAPSGFDRFASVEFVMMGSGVRVT